VLRGLSELHMLVLVRRTLSPPIALCENDTKRLSGLLIRLALDLKKIHFHRPAEHGKVA
jgi:hypothetical protein